MTRRDSDRAAALEALRAEVIACRLCPRLVEHREAVAEDPPRRYAGQRYWARPLPGWGGPEARLLIVGLAPAANGGNRTGRIFTGDRSGDFLFAGLFRAGLATRPASTSRHDGTELIGTYIAAVNRCAPPGNRPTPDERDRCLPYLVRELEILGDARVIVALGAFAWDGTLRALGTLGHRVHPRPVFAHGLAERIGPYTVVGCLHPSQQNTFTRRLTPPMLDSVLQKACELAGLPGL